MSLNPSARHPVYKNKYNPTPSETTPHNSSPRAPIKKKKKSKYGAIDSTWEQIQRNHINRLQSRIARGRAPHRPSPWVHLFPRPSAFPGTGHGSSHARSLRCAEPAGSTCPLRNTRAPRGPYPLSTQPTPSSSCAPALPGRGPLGPEPTQRSVGAPSN